MVYEISFMDDAKDELGKILYFLNYIRMLGNAYSERVKSRILNEIRRLSSSPEIYQLTEIRDRYGHKYRKMVVNKRYIVLYYIDYNDRIVYIAHIFDGRSNYLEDYFNL